MREELSLPVRGNPVSSIYLGNLLLKELFLEINIYSVRKKLSVH